MGLKERLVEYIDFKGLSVKSFETKCGLSNGAVSKMGDNTRRSTIDNISKSYPDLNQTWLLTGEGEMLKEESGETKPAVAKQKNIIPFYDDVATIGGHNDVVADTSGSGHISEWIDVGDWFPEATAVIRHYGDSMVEYPSGSLLAVKRLNDWRLIIWGRNYVVETTEFRITKKLQDGGDCYILAYSSNMSTYPDGTLIHSPVRIPKETIRHIDMVLGCVTKEYSNASIKVI